MSGSEARQLLNRWISHKGKLRERNGVFATNSNFLISNSYIFATDDISNLDYLM